MKPMEKCVADWHRHLRGELPGGLDTILTDDVVFYSPVVFTPQEGKEITKLYLGAAGNTLGGDDEPASDDKSSGTAKFRYVREVVGDFDAMLEFETSMDGKYVNGVDILTCNEDGKIVEFRAMIRPLQAINAVHAAMGRMLETMKGKP